MKNKKKFKGFTVIEILVIVAIIAILVTVVLVNLMGARSKAQDNSAFASFKSLAAPAFMCLTSGPAGVSLMEYAAGYNICSNSDATPDAIWPDFSKYGWADFHWCDVNSLDGSIPATGSYDGVSYGSNFSGEFCFMLQKDTKYMWCTLKGCEKIGF